MTPASYANQVDLSHRPATARSAKYLVHRKTNMTPPIATARLPASGARLRPLALTDMIRVGRDHDGGYVLPRRIIDAADAVLALGLNDDWSFEEALVAMKADLIIHGYDHTVGHRSFAREVAFAMARLPLGKGTITQLRERWKTLKSYKRFFSSPNRHYAQKITDQPDTPLETDINGALQQMDSDHILIKMDIEGSEYRIVDQLVENADRIVGACIEFHDIHPFRIVFNSVIDTLCGPFAIAHAHPNNYGKVSPDGMPDVLEITFVNRRLLCDEPFRSEIHLPALDQANDQINPDISLLM